MVRGPMVALLVGVLAVAVNVPAEAGTPMEAPRVFVVKELIRSVCRSE